MSFSGLPQSCAEESLSSWIKRQKKDNLGQFHQWSTLCTGEKTRNYSTTVVSRLWPQIRG